MKEFRKALSQETKAMQDDVFRSHSDANLLQGVGCPAVIFGPGQLAKAHTIDEYVNFGEVVAAAQIYSRLASSAT